MSQCESEIQFQECFQSPELKDCQENQEFQNCQDDDEIGFQSIFTKCRYIQPPRVKSFRPKAYYQKPQIPFASETVYKGSYDLFAVGCRPQPFKPFTNIQKLCGPISNCTVTKCSFQPSKCVEKVQPIYPKTNKIFGSECPLQSLTTQKHDFVFKFRPKRTQVIPSGNLGFCDGKFESNTVHRMSFVPTYGICKPKSFRPQVYYKKPELPMATDTTHKMSFQPTQIPCREKYPWTQKPKYCRPTITFANDTITKLSFQPPGCFVDTKCVDKMMRNLNECC